MLSITISTVKYIVSRYFFQRVITGVRSEAEWIFVQPQTKGRKRREWSGFGRRKAGSMMKRGQWFPMRGGGALGRLILILRLSISIRQEKVVPTNNAFERKQRKKWIQRSAVRIPPEHRKNNGIRDTKRENVRIIEVIMPTVKEKIYLRLSIALLREFT